MKKTIAAARPSQITGSVLDPSAVERGMTIFLSFVLAPDRADRPPQRLRCEVRDRRSEGRPRDLAGRRVPAGPPAGQIFAAAARSGGGRRIVFKPCARDARASPVAGSPSDAPAACIRPHGQRSSERLSRMSSSRAKRVRSLAARRLARAFGVRQPEGRAHAPLRRR